MRIIVTGANGFIGRAFCAEARRRNHTMLGLTRAPANDLECEVAPGSLQDVPWKEIEKFQPDTALHLAWIATPGVYLTSPENDLLVAQSQDLVRGLAQRGVRHFAGAGTCIEYAASPLPLREDQSPLAATFPYTSAKASLFQWLTDSAPALNLSSSWFRIFYPYGPGEHANRLPSLIIRSLASGKPMALRTPDSVKDYIYIEDLVRALCMALEARLTGAINLGSGKGVLISDLAMTIAEVLGVNPKLVCRADPLTPDPWPIQIADVHRLRTIGWSHETSLTMGLMKLVSRLTPVL